MTYQKLLKKHIEEKCKIQVNVQDRTITFRKNFILPRYHILEEVGEDYLILKGDDNSQMVFPLLNTVCIFQ